MVRLYQGELFFKNSLFNRFSKRSRQLIFLGISVLFIIEVICFIFSHPLDWASVHIPWLEIFAFLGAYVTWTGLRGIRYWLLLDKPKGFLVPILTITYVHHAAIDVIPWRGGVFAYPLLTKYVTGLRWRRVLSSLVESTLGDGVVAYLGLTILAPETLRLFLIMTALLFFVCGVQLPRLIIRIFRHRHHVSLLIKRGIQYCILALHLIYSYPLRKHSALWFGLSLLIVFIKFTSLTWLLSAWIKATGFPSLTFFSLTVSLMIAELSREIPLHTWLNIGTWEFAWLVVIRDVNRLPSAFLAHASYEIAVLLSALPAAVYLAIHHHNPTHLIHD